MHLVDEWPHVCVDGSGKVDIIVVYKVDRLTRSLLDFAKLVEALDAAVSRSPSRSTLPPAWGG